MTEGDGSRKSIEEIKEEDEEKYLEAMKLFDELIDLASRRKPNLVSGLRKNKEKARDKYVNNLYGGTENITNPYLNQNFLKITIPKLKHEMQNLNAIIYEGQEKARIEEEREQKAAQLWKKPIHDKADEEFSQLIKWMQDIYDEYLLVFNKINFEIFTKRKIAKLDDTLFKYSKSHTNSLLKQYLYDLDNFEKKSHDNFHIKNMGTVIKDWFWLYDTIHWILQKEAEGERIIVSPDEPIIFTDEELELESNKEYAERFNERTQWEAVKIVADLIERVYTGLGIDNIAKKFSIEVRPL